MKATRAQDLVALAINAAWDTKNVRLGTALSHLAGIASISWSKKIDTACIRRTGDTYRIEISREFARTFLKEPADVLFVLLHEIFHKIGGDLVRVSDGSNDPLKQMIANIVADIRINSALRETFFGKVPLLERLYKKLELPTLLLLPADDFLGWLGPDSDWDPFVGSPIRGTAARTFASLGLSKRRAGQLADWYLDAWNTEASHENLYERLLALLVDTKGANPIFLGDHEATGEGMPGWEDVLSREAGHGDNALEDEIVPALPSGEVGALQQRIVRALGPDPRNPHDASAFAPERSVLPNTGRREAFLLAQGVWPVFFTPPVHERHEEEYRVHMYLDVSGSTQDVQPFLYGLVHHLGHLVGEPIYLFSNQVHEISLRDLREGRRVSTGGTDFDCVVEHASRHRKRKVLIVTDGYAEIQPRNVELLRRDHIELYVLLTMPNPGCPLVPLAREHWLLPRLAAH